MEEAGKELKTKAIFNGERRFIFEMAIVLLLGKAKLLLQKSHCDITREDTISQKDIGKMAAF